MTLKLTTPPVLVFLDFEKQFTVETEATLVVIRSVQLPEKDDGKMHQVQYAS